MKYLGLTTAIAFLASGGSVFALDFGPGLSLTGKIGLEYVNGQGSSSTFGVTDLTLSWRNQSGGALTFGADASYVSLYNFDGGDNLASLWAGLVVGTSFGEFSIGRPRPLLDTMFETPDVAGSSILDLTTSLYGDSFAATVVLISNNSIDPLGVTFKGQSGALSYGLGVHRLEESGSSVDILEGGITYSMGAANLFAGYESVGLSGSSFDRVSLGGNYAADRWSVGGKVTRLLSGGSSADIVKVFGDYKVTDALTLGVQVVDLGAPLNGTIVGANGTYSFGQGFAELGVGASDNGGGTSTFGTASIGFKF